MIKMTECYIPPETMDVLDEAIKGLSHILTEPQLILTRKSLLKNFNHIQCRKITPPMNMPVQLFNQKLIRQYIQHKATTNCSKKTVKHYQSTLHGYMLYLWEQDITIVTPDMIREYFKYKQDTCNPRTINGIYRELHAFYEYLLQERITTSNPLHNIKPPKYQKQLITGFNKQEIIKIRGACNNSLERAIIETLLHTGLRRHELTSMTKDCIHRDTVTITGKGGKQRTVYLHGAEQYIHRYRIEYNPPNNILWLNPQRHRLTDSGLSNILRKISERCRIHCNAHRFRHTFATTLHQNGCPMHIIQKLLGHEQMGTTMIYTQQDNTDIHHNYMKYMKGGG